MGRGTMSRDAYDDVHQQATRGGTRSATADAEEQVRRGGGLDISVDPKGYPHLGPVRMSLPRFEKDEESGLWVLTMGPPMALEDLLDTTGSMQDNVDKAFKVLPLVYQMLTSGKKPILGRYDVQMATGIFNDVEDGIPVLSRSQFEMAEKIAAQMTKLSPGRNGCGNGKEDSQFGIFGAAYLTAASITRWGLKSYHFTISDEPIVESIDLGWLKRIFGDDVLERVKETGNEFTPKNVPSTAQAVTDLQKKAHAFFLMVGERPDVKRQWTDLYGRDHVVKLHEGTTHLHHVKSVIIGLTEGVFDLENAQEFLREHEVTKEDAKHIVGAVAHIPLGAQARFPNFAKLPKAGDLFKNKTDLWPVDPNELDGKGGKKAKKVEKKTDWL